MGCVRGAWLRGTMGDGGRRSQNGGQEMLDGQDADHKPHEQIIQFGAWFSEKNVLIHI